MSARGAPPSALSTVSDRVDARLDELLAAEQTRWSELDDRLDVPFAQLRDFLQAGGKRLRPAFCYWGYIGAGGDADGQAIIDCCAALELLHSFALIHDDVMDGSSRRRGRDTVHVTFAQRHHDRGWSGENRRFAEGAAVLVGDLAFVYADVLMTDATQPMIDIFNEMRIELNVGQYLDMLGAAQRSNDLDAARQIAVFKSGKYTVERPLHLGAAQAQRFADLGPIYTAYGIPLGEAFQLRDDLLGAFANETEIGKPVGDDFREGKSTPLVVTAHAVAIERGDRRSLEALARLGDPNLSDGEIKEIRDALEVTGARAFVEQRIDELVRQALRPLETARIDPTAFEALSDLARYIAWRPS